MVRPHPGRRLATVALVAAAAAACSDVDHVAEYRALQGQVAEEATRTWAVVPAAPAGVERVVVEGGGRRVEVRRSADGLWAPGEGATATSASLMSEAQAQLLPLSAYRRLAVDAAQPDFGLTGEGTTLTVDAAGGGHWRVRLGALTPTGGGHYAQREGDAFVYTVAPRVVDLAASLLAGTVVERPADPRLQQIREFEDRTVDPEEVTNPWLAQALRSDG